jgi:hypothetical protein
VETQRYIGEPRRVVVWRKGENGPWIIWGSMPIPEDIDSGILIAEVFKRLPQPTPQADIDRVHLKLKIGMGQAT